ncbi:response regulator [Pyxidicoccus sp. 3LG]
MVRRVLVLEDDDDLRTILGELLRMAGVETCVEAGSYDELVRKKDAVLGCDLALLDVNLGAGVESGLDGHRWLRENGFEGRTVFLTGHARSHPLVRQAYELQHVRVLSKPVSTQVLLELLRDGPSGNPS